MSTARLGRVLRIPRIFHRIWLGEKPLPAEFASFGRTWEKLHPGWQMKLWTDRNLPPLYNRWAFGRSTTQSGRANVLRYELLHRFGGVYIDTDFECLKNFEPLLTGVDCFAGIYGEGGSEHGTFTLVNNAIIGCIPGHPLLRDLVAEVRDNMRGLMLDTTIQAHLTGPIFFTYTLLRHPEVKLFPERYFYPYSPIERWRRHDRFPRAYAVHHWTLSGLSVLRPTGRRWGRGPNPSLSVVLHPVVPLDALRLRWVLEGLCAQRIADFEVIAFAPPRRSALARCLALYRSRLQMRLLRRPRTPRGKNAGAILRNAALHQARAPRVLFLDADCMPDHNVIDRHAWHGKRNVGVFGYLRVYPAAYLFPCDMIDYGSMREMARSETESAPLAPRSDFWRDLRSYCFSLPTAAARALGGFDSTHRGDAVRRLAQRLDAAGCPSVPCLYGATVTWFGPRRQR